MPLLFVKPYSMKLNFLQGNVSDPSKDNGLMSIRLVCIIGAVGIFFVSIWGASGKGSLWSTLGLSGVVALAAMLCGGGYGLSVRHSTIIAKDNYN